MRGRERERERVRDRERRLDRGGERGNVSETETVRVRENTNRRETPRVSDSVRERNLANDRFVKYDEAPTRANVYEWQTVSHRKHRGAAKQTHGGNGRRQQYHRRNWRDDADITSFYFTNFSEEVTKMELWSHFNQWGEVKEVFIPNRRNKEGKRYGFVRLRGVTDVRNVEKALDNSFIRGVKLHVNTPKYGRGEMMKVHIKQKPMGAKTGKDGPPCTDEASRKGVVGTSTTKSYAEAVMALGRKSNSSTKEVNQFGNNTSTCSTFSLAISVEDKARYQNAWVGRLKNIAIFERLEEEMVWNVGSGISASYMGDDMAILFGLSEKKAADIIRQEKEQSSSLFYSLTKWSPQLRAETRLVWLRVWGIPLLAWKTDFMRRMVAAVGDFVDVDDDVEHMQRLDRARILVRTPRPPLIQHVAHVLIDGVRHRIDIVEENGGGELGDTRHGRNLWSSSEEVPSDVADDDMDSVISWPSGTFPPRDAGISAGDTTADCRDARSSPLPVGCSRDVDPAVNDLPDRVLTTLSPSGSVVSPSRKLFELAIAPQPTHPATIHEYVADPVLEGQNLPHLSNTVSTSSPKAFSDGPFEEGDIPSPGRILKNNSHINGSHTPPFESFDKQTHHLNGPCTPVAQQTVSHSPHQKQQMLSSGLQVYSRRMWCKKKKAHQELVTHNNSASSKNQEEAAFVRQCDLLNQMGLTCGEDFQQLMGSLVDMEQRDSDLVAEKGHDSCANDNLII